MPKRKIEPASLDQVHIVWEDAWLSLKYWTRDELKKEGPCLMHQVGFLIYEDKEKLVLSFGQQEGRDSWRDIQIIPKCLIRGREIVKRGKRKK